MILNMNEVKDRHFLGFGQGSRYRIDNSIDLGYSNAQNLYFQVLFLGFTPKPTKIQKITIIHIGPLKRDPYWPVKGIPIVAGLPRSISYQTSVIYIYIYMHIVIFIYIYIYICIYIYIYISKPTIYISNR